MKGDFSRGSYPDRKRSKEYRRVLLQQGRVLLDSDAAAMVDAFDREVRDVAADLGCHAGSPDLGFLITPGRLLALFEHVDGVVPASSVTAYRDYSRKYPNAPHDRYPSLRAVGAGDLRVRLVEPLAASTASYSVNLVFWCRADQNTSFTVKATGGTAVTVNVTGSSAPTWQRRPVTITVPAAGTAELVLVPHASEPVWIGLVETAENASDGPHFWAAAGHFHLDGLIGKRPVSGGYPDITWPVAAGFGTDHTALEELAANTRIAAYLEVWERDITFVEDPGIREVALGGVDTTVRTQVVAQVKWAPVPAAAQQPALDTARLARAFENVVAPTGTIIVDAPATPPSNDPCALPISGGYTGADHRLYRFEVHTGGSATGAEFKWSRDNGSELFPAIRVDGNRVTLVRGSGLADGDLVEVLSEKVEVDDQDPAVIDASGETFTPPVRKIGVLARLKQEPSDEQGRDVFSLLDRNAGTPIALTSHANRYVDARVPGGTTLVPIKLRRWHGVAKATLDAPSGKHRAEIEDGIRIEVAGQFRSGSWWQYEARRGQSNDNDGWRPQPHGPERLFAPLAVLTWPGTPASNPMVLDAWLDHRFSPLCELDADDVVFDGDRVGSPSETVQEALEELFLDQGGGGCCDASLAPGTNNADDGQRIEDAIGAPTFPEGGHLCLAPGVYNILSTIEVHRDVVIRGCPDAVLLNRVTSGPIFAVDKTVRLELGELTLYSGQQPTADELVRMDPTSRLVAREVGFLAESRNESEVTGVAIRVGVAEPVVPDLDSGDDPVIDPDQGFGPVQMPHELVLEDCVVLARHGIVGGSIDLLAIEDCAFVVGRGAVSAQTVGRLVASGSSFASGLGRGFFANVDPGSLRATSDGVLDSALHLSPAGGWAMAVEWILGGHIERCQFAMDIGLWARVARDLRALHNTYGAGAEDMSPPTQTYGIRLHHARRVDIDHETMNIPFGAGIHVPLSAVQLTIRRCTVTAYEAGIAFAQELPYWHDQRAAGAFDQVAIIDNTVLVNNPAIQFDSGVESASTWNVAIRGNTLRGAAGIVGLVPANAFTEIAGNDITCTGVAVALGSLARPATGDYWIHDNRLRCGDAIFCYRASSLRVEDNEITLHTYTLGRVVYCYETPAVRIVANRAQRYPGNLGTSRTLDVWNATRVDMLDNDVNGPIGVSAAQSGGLVNYCNNRTEGVTVMTAGRGMIQDNIITGNLTQQGLSGDWIVAHNLISGQIITNAQLVASGVLEFLEPVLRLDRPLPLPGETGARAERAPMSAISAGDTTALLAAVEELALDQMFAPVRDFMTSQDAVVLRPSKQAVDVHMAGNVVGRAQPGTGEIQ